MRKLMMCFLMVLVSGCAQVPQYPSTATVTLANSKYSVPEVLSRIAAAGAAGGASVTTLTDHQCVLTEPSGQNQLTYSQYDGQLHNQTPNLVYTFTAVQLGKDVQISVSAVYVSFPGTPMQQTSPHTTEDLQAMLDKLAQVAQN